jgi:probable F420-dependent oxidoreductase
MTRSIAAGIGLAEFPFGTTSGFWRWIDVCEQGGVDSFWQTDRLVSRHPILECLSALAAVAGRTRRMKLGMNVLSLAMREPVLVAKQCATIDVLSDGRMLPGFGIGSPLAPEWRALALDTRTRGARTDEALEIIRLLWTEERVDFDGRFWPLSGVSISPRPVQAELPIWIGGSSDAAIRRTARFGTGWQAGPEMPAQAQEAVAAIKRALGQAGRQIDEDHYGAGIPFRFGRTDEPGLADVYDAYRARTGRDPSGYFAIGDAATILGRIAEYVESGISKFILRPVARGEEDMLEQTRRLIETVLPVVAVRWPRPRAA